MSQYFKNTADPTDNRILDSAVAAKQNAAGVWEFWTHDPAAGGIQMTMPTTLVPMTAAEIAAFTAPPAVPLKTQAANALPETDMVCLRCYKAGVPFPASWQTYTTGLRNIANGTDTTSTALPTKPAYPAGT